jgi:hypothetical protein
MKKEFMNLFLFIGICLLVYVLFRSFNYNIQYKLIEGMTDSSGNTVDNGAAGNAASYGAMIKAATIKLQDSFLVSKYRTDYETVILNLDDYLNNLMLQNALSFDMKNPGKSLSKLGEIKQAKTALNDVMKFVDSSK